MKGYNESLASIKRQIRDYNCDPQGKLGGKAQVRITTARELSGAEYEALVGNLSAKMGRELFVEKQVDPAIVGGVIVQIGDNILDGSVARQLRKYEEMMTGIDVKKIGVTNAV